MNPWTAVLQSVHSALIDELTDRHPDPKPELGLPVRQSGYVLPEPGLSSVLVCELELVGTRGILLIASEPGFGRALKLGPEELWSAILKRAGGEFARRGIQPAFYSPLNVVGGGPLPKHLPIPGRLVWIPFSIPGGRCFLGMGV